MSHGVGIEAHQKLMFLGNLVPRSPTTYDFSVLEAHFRGHATGLPGDTKELVRRALADAGQRT